MNKISKFILIAIIALAGIIVIAMANSEPSPQDKYAGEAVRVLESYKDFKIDAKDAASRLDDLMSAIRTEKQNTKGREDQRRLEALWLDLVSIQTKLYHSGKASGYEIDQAIKAIKAN